MIHTNTKIKPPLDLNFTPAILWVNEYQAKLKKNGNGKHFLIALERANGSVSRYETTIFPHTSEFKELNTFYIERILKFLLWMKGGYRIFLAGDLSLSQDIQKLFKNDKNRLFDSKIIGKKVYGKNIEVIFTENFDEIPARKSTSLPIGGNKDGCRIGFDLGGSDRKVAAVENGEVVFSEEIPWDPYFQKDPQYHLDGIEDSLKKCAAYLPQIDAIGGSAAGVYVNNTVRIASLFRGVSEEDFNRSVKNIFFDIQKKWGDVPMVVVNDGEVTALAGSMNIGDNALLGVSMGTSEAVGYVNEKGFITDWLNELAFAPIDFRKDAPVDEWSGDIGCGVQYFSQQAVARLVKETDIALDPSLTFPEILEKVQKLMSQNDERAKLIYRTIGVYFGYTCAWYSHFYNIKNILILGRVTSGAGGNSILAAAKEVLEIEFPNLDIEFHIPDEKMKRHGQAVAAASLPSLKS